MEKKLRKGSDKKVCGVCSGIAEYFGWDVTMVRIATVVISCFYGAGLIAYVVGAIVMPDKEKEEI